MKYNTSRVELKFPEYGRAVQKMVDHIKTLPDKTERTKAANTLVNIIVSLNPALKEQSEYRHKLWDHLYYIADFDLDVDAPFPPPLPLELAPKPQKPAYSSNHIRYKFYGKNVERMIQKAVEMEDSPDKVAFVNALGSYMKMAHRVWNEDKVPDELIIQHIKEFSKGAIVLTEINEFAAHNENFNPPKKNNQPNNNSGSSGGAKHNKKKKNYRKNNY